MSAKAQNETNETIASALFWAMEASGDKRASLCAEAEKRIRKLIESRPMTLEELKTHTKGNPHDLTE